MDAVLRFGGHDDGERRGVTGVTTNGHTIENMAFDAAQLANYSVAAAVQTAVGAALYIAISLRTLFLVPCRSACFFFF